MEPDEIRRFNALVQQVHALEGKVTFLLRHLGVQYPEPAPPSDEVTQLVVKGDKLNAIKVYMKNHGVGLVEAKRAIEDMAARLGL
jgi:ribosomal protein L7/L12